MIIESILVIVFALAVDLIFGDPKNRFHPTAWMGSVISKLIPLVKNKFSRLEKLGGIFVVLTSSIVIILPILLLTIGIDLIFKDVISIIISVIIGSILLKTTIAIRGMEKHALKVIESLESNDIDSARNNLSMIVKRNTKNLDKDHVYSSVIESISENTVDGITSPLFYFALFGLPGAFLYRTINTIDSMIGYKNNLFKNIGWFGASCDSILNYIPSRLTGVLMILSALILRNDWKRSLVIMMRDRKKTESLNAGYPMAAIAGALGTKFEKLDHYSLGDGEVSFSPEHVKSAIAMMKITSLLFTSIVVIPIIIISQILGSWIYA